MNRSMLAILVSGLLVGGCSDPEMEQRIASLEKEVEQLKSRPAGPGGAAAASPEQEQAAANLLKEAQAAYTSMEIDTAKAKLAELREKFGNTRAFRAAQRIESEVAVVGKDEASLDVEKWYQGSKADVEGGKATLYVFWEVWCPHCKREVPKLSATYDKYRSKGLTMVGLTKQTRNVTDDAVTEFVSAQGVSYPIAKESGTALSRALRRPRHSRGGDGQGWQGRVAWSSGSAHRRHDRRLPRKLIATS